MTWWFCLIRFLMPQTQPEREGTSSWILQRKMHTRSDDLWISFVYWNISTSVYSGCQVMLEKQNNMFKSIKHLHRPHLVFINLNKNVLAVYNCDHVWFCFQVFFVESLCDDPEVIAANILVSVIVNVYHCCYITRSCQGWITLNFIGNLICSFLHFIIIMVVKDCMEIFVLFKMI